MSHVIKFNTAMLSMIGSVVCTGVYVMWLASTKANEIDTAKADIQELKVSDRNKSEILSRLDERTTLILKQLEGITSKLK